ncbi:MAG: ornithine cyclodeaminase [Bacteroidales bacterium]|nr:ornithine cyclodeaminase [Candidatus Colicola equi]
MTTITNEQIKALHITPKQCVEWVTESFKMKYEAQLPPKISVHPEGIDFYTSMPCLLPTSFNRFGVKVVSRINGRKPALHSDLLLYEASSGQLLSLMDADWITQMRTGAVAALTIQMLQKKDAHIYAFVGLGSVAKATMECFLAILPQNQHIIVKLQKYKDQAETFITQFADSRVTYQIVDTHKQLVQDSDVVISAVTEMTELFCADDSLFKEGVLVVPIHTRGFQNCDLFFNHVFADDRGHVQGFKYFSQFKSFNELSEVLLGNIPARQSDKERILAYNIGLGLHDVVFATKIYERFSC